MEIRAIMEEMESGWKKEEATTSGWESKRRLVNSSTFNDPTVNYGQCLHEFKWIFSISFPDEFSLYLGCSIFPSPEQNLSLSHYQGMLNTGGSLPDLSNLHFTSPLSTPLDPEDNGGYPNLSGGSSTGNLPAAMMHLGIGNSQGGWSI